VGAAPRPRSALCLIAECAFCREQPQAAARRFAWRLLPLAPRLIGQCACSFDLIVALI
jgi:hypothetical protein